MRLLSIAVFGLILSGCGSYLSPSMRASLNERIQLSTRQVEQCRAEMGKLYGYAYQDAHTWADPASRQLGWGPTDLADTRQGLDRQKELFNQWLLKLDNARDLLNTARSDLGGY